MEHPAFTEQRVEAGDLADDWNLQATRAKAGGRGIRRRTNLSLKESCRRNARREKNRVHRAKVVRRLRTAEGTKHRESPRVFWGTTGTWDILILLVSGI